MTTMRGSLDERPTSASTDDWYIAGDHQHAYKWVNGAWEMQGLPVAQGGAHPDLAAHTTLGLSAEHAHPYAGTVHEHDAAYLHAHPYSATAHNHDAAYAPTHAHPYSSDVHLHAGVYEAVHSHPYAGTSHSHVDGDLPAGIARDSEVAAAYSPLGHTHAGGGGMTLMKTTSDQIINGTGFVNITGLTFPVVANTDYAFDFYITIRAATTATGWRVSVNGPAGEVDFMRKYQTVANSDVVGVATWLEGHAVAFDTMTVLATSIAANVDLHARITGRFKCGGAGGTFAARVASEAANNEIVVQKGSWGTAW